jgi:F0F1-type ATP synthase delta subunit
MADKKPEYDPFIIEQVFPDPLAIFRAEPSLKEVIESSVFILDANCILAPFLVGKDSLTDVAKVFGLLVEQNRLYLPKQAVREFGRHRGQKVAEVCPFEQAPQPIAT